MDTRRDVAYSADCLVVGQTEPPSKRIFHEPFGCLNHVEVKVPVCTPASSKTGPLENPRSPAAFVTTRSGSQRKGATAGLKNSDQAAITSCFPCIVLRRPRNWASSAIYEKNFFASRSANALANATSVARTSSVRSAAETRKEKTRRNRQRLDSKQRRFMSKCWLNQA